MEGPKEHSAIAEARLCKCMQEPFVRDRALLYDLLRRHRAGETVTDTDFDGAYCNALGVELTVDSDVADTWYDAK